MLVAVLVTCAYHYQSNMKYLLFPKTGGGTRKWDKPSHALKILKSIREFVDLMCLHSFADTVKYQK